MTAHTHQLVEATLATDGYEQLETGVWRRWDEPTQHSTWLRDGDGWSYLVGTKLRTGWQLGRFHDELRTPSETLADLAHSRAVGA